MHVGEYVFWIAYDMKIYLRASDIMQLMMFCDLNMLNTTANWLVMCFEWIGNDIESDG